MPSPRYALLLGSCLLIGSATLTWYWQLPAIEERLSLEPEQLPTPQAAQASPTPASSPLSTEQLQLLARPEIQQQEQRLGFHQRYRDFIEHAKQLDAEKREAQAEDLSKGLDAMEQRGELALSEALLLQIALIKAVSKDEAEQKRRAEALIKRYQVISAEREARLEQQPDPNFERYKAEEKRIVEEVLELQNIPDGLTRDQYLRQRLQEARERNYRQAPNS
ncbi:hypothetical protein EGJ23_04845 [Pseudomonas sp. o96-267]|uniref:hypothetical protein n=1 Tax=Pseudomonas sp. o96-267 TaxID=2479853 RepID=UPI000F78CBC8|nr:hypothetical protein [Pseudomonas sp. o96-267]RRV28710.1 hypothetical protein EGJ23_04845 [Pseudomonas sp. o96-267]